VEETAGRCCGVLTGGCAVSENESMGFQSYLFGVHQKPCSAISDHGIFHGIASCDHRKTRVDTGFLWLIDNRVGVGGIHNILKNNNKTNPIDNIICIINGIIHGIYCV
jgi:hypothetical protein